MTYSCPAVSADMCAAVSKQSHGCARRHFARVSISVALSPAVAITSCSAATKNRVASLLQCPLREYPSRIGRCIRVTLDGTHRSDRHSRFGTRSRDARKTRQLSRKKEPTRRLHCLDSIAPCARLQMRARGSSASSALEAGSLVRERHRCRQGVLSLGKEADFAVLESAYHTKFDAVNTSRSCSLASIRKPPHVHALSMRHYRLNAPTCTDRTFCSRRQPSSTARSATCPHETRARWYSRRVAPPSAICTLEADV
eukprot:1141570-Pleurochrysis_carterae.AAC.3